MIDAFSKKIWTRCMNVDTTATKALAVLYGWFCDETGSPTTLVSDNDPQFTSHELIFFYVLPPLFRTKIQNYM